MWCRLYGVIYSVSLRYTPLVEPVSRRVTPAGPERTRWCRGEGLCGARSEAEYNNELQWTIAYEEDTCCCLLWDTKAGLPFVRDLRTHSTAPNVSHDFVTPNNPYFKRESPPVLQSVAVLCIDNQSKVQDLKAALVKNVEHHCLLT